MYIELFLALAIAVLGWFSPLAAVAIASQSYILRSLTGLSPVYTEVWGLLHPAISHLFLLAATFRRKRIVLPTLTPHDIAASLLLAVLLVGSLHAPDPVGGIEKAFRFLGLAYMYYILLRVYLYNGGFHIDRSINSYLSVVWSISLITAILAFSQGVYVGNARLTLGNAHPIPFGMLIATGLIVNLWCLLQHLLGYRKYCRRIPLTFQIVSFLFLSYIFILTNNRGPFISFSLSALYMLFIGLSRYETSCQSPRKLVSVIFLTVLTIGAFSLAWREPRLAHRVGSAFSTLLSGSEPGSPDLSTLERLDAWHTAIDLFAGHFVLGVGTGGFSFYSKLDYPHNILLELAAEGGLVALLPGLFFYMVVLWEVAKPIFIRLPPISTLFSSLVLLNFIEGQVSYSIWMHKSLFIALAILVTLNQLGHRIQPRLRSVSPGQRGGRAFHPHPERAATLGSELRRGGGTQAGTP